jgi:hypothetical protein
VGRSCTVCESPERDEIDVQLASGRPRRAVATRYRRTEASVRRHADGHLQPGLHRVAEQRESLRLGALLERLVELANYSDAIMADALGAGGDNRLALAAIKESREVIGAISRLTGPRLPHRLPHHQHRSNRVDNHHHPAAL